LKIGITTMLTERSIDVADLARRVEELGFESIWAPEQPILPVRMEVPAPREWGDLVDPFIMLARASAATTRIKLGTDVCVVTERNPLSLAKQIATLDMYSGGRFLFGIGVGAIREEAEIMGSDYPHRWTQAGEAVAAMKELWTKEESEFHGTYYDFPPVYCFPKPARRPHPPIILGGLAPNVFKRTVAWGDGWIPISVTPGQVREGRAKLDDLAGASGRDPASIEISVVDLPADRSVIQEYADAGADRAIIGLPTVGKDESLAELERIAREVLR
jgi:probable F420-dependent oxidoreductase